jgi:hypothetical protein
LKIYTEYLGAYLKYPEPLLCGRGIFMVQINEKNLVKISVLGEVSNPLFGANPYRISAVTGKPIVVPGTGGITFNIRVGDRAVGWEADHVEPGVSIKNTTRDDLAAQGPNTGLNILSCVGNEATVVTGDAKGKKGTVTGKHGGIEHVLVDFDWSILEKLVISDKIQVKSYGVGLKLLDFPEVTVMNTDPRLIKAMNLTGEKGRLVVPVTHIIPAGIMGSGIGQNHSFLGDYDINMFDSEMVRKHNLGTLRLGDIVAISDADHAYGRIYKKGTNAIGIVVHCNSVVAGHGPGVTSLMSSPKIIPTIDDDANIAKLLKLRKGI